MLLILWGEALLVLAAIPVYNRSGVALSGVPILFGMVLSWVFAGSRRAERIDFAHLTERAMLYVVFTFGEMIIAIAFYFEGVFSWNSVYFSTMSFLIVVGLFLSYEIFYNHIIDREQQSAGMGYMLLHIFLILAMNSITASLDFMRDEAVALWPKTLFLIGAVLLYYGCLFGLSGFAKPMLTLRRGQLWSVIGVTAAFAVLMVLLRENMRMNILISVVYVFAVFGLILRHSRMLADQ